MSQLATDNDNDNDFSSEQLYKEILKNFQISLQQSLTIEVSIKKSEEEILKGLDDILANVQKTIDYYETKIKTLKQYIKNISNELAD